ncbi:MAG TPA: hypothetical protein VFD36_29245 [Kofleriaceae bacterium]|nr:hypothetical protein [Kofleriaceae bacterium]
MSYFRGLSADPWAGAGDPSLLGQITGAITGGLDKLLGAGAPSSPTPTTTPGHPAPLTEAEKAKVLGTLNPVAPVALPGGSNTPKLLMVVALVGVAGFILYKNRPTSNPARRRRRRRSRRHGRRSR